MKTVGQRLDSFRVTGVKPGFNHHEESGISAFQEITEASFPGKWKVIYFYPKDFTFVCPTEIVGFAKLAADFEDRDAVLLAGSTDNEFVKLAWRRDHKDLDRLNHWMFADSTGALVDLLGVRDAREGVALRATFIVDPDGLALALQFVLAGECAGGFLGLALDVFDDTFGCALRTGLVAH